MNETEVAAAAQKIAGNMIESARGSGDDPIYWVTSNALFPPLRAYREAERVYQDDDASMYWGFLVLEVERLLEEADVAIETGPDGSLYVVDMTRFEFIDDDDKAETLQAQYRMYNSGMTG